MKYDDPTAMVQTGNFSDNTFQPTNSEWISSYGDCQDTDSITYSLNDESIKFIDEHPELFPADNESDLEELIDYDVEYKQLNKNITPYLTRLIEKKLYVVQIEVYPDMYGKDATFIILENNDGSEVYYVIYFGDTGDIYEDDTVTCIGLPIAQSSYKNVLGGYTKCIVVFGSQVIK